MYFDFYDFKEAPFNLTPSSKYFFSSSKHVEALSTLIYAINERKGFVVITGDIGSGKTTVCRALINQLDAKTQSALITNTRMSGKDLLMSILEDFEVDYEPGSKSKLHSQLNEYLIDQLRQDRNVVLLIDEAQNLSPAVLEEIRMLSNLETEHEKLIQIIFLGQPELKSKLALPQLEQLRQRIAVYFHLTPLSEDDTYKYIVHRLHIASSKSSRNYFTDEAMRLIYRYSKGVPRLINQICDSAFLTGFIKEVSIIDKRILMEVIEESPMIQISSMDKSKYLSNEEKNIDDVQSKSLKLKLKKKQKRYKSKLNKKDAKTFSLTQKHLAGMVETEPKKKKESKKTNTKVAKKKNKEPAKQTIKKDELAKTDQLTTTKKFGKNRIKNIDDDITTEKIGKTQYVRIPENKSTAEHIGAVEGESETAETSFFANKLPIIMMILFSIFVVASIILFYEII